MPSLIWFGQLLDPMKNSFLSNSFFAKFKSSVWKTNFFLGNLYQKFFLFYTLITLVIFHSKFGLIWTITWPDENELFLKFAKICISRNSQNTVWKPNFFPRQAVSKILFALHSHHTGDTSCRVWFDLDSSLTRWKRALFKIHFSRNSKVPYEKLTFS